jgi:ankyrin repeat protein
LDAFADSRPISPINERNEKLLHGYPGFKRQWNIAARLTRTVPPQTVDEDQEAVSTPTTVIKSHAAPHQNAHFTFIQLAVLLLSNGHVDPQVDNILVRLCLDPRNLATVKNLLGQDLHSTQAFSEKLFFPAVASCNITLVEFLMRSGVDPFAIRSDGIGWDSGLTKAVRTGNSGVVRAVLDVFKHSHGCKKNTTSFKKRADWSAKAALYLAVSQSNGEVLEALFNGLPSDIFRTAALMEAQAIIYTASTYGLTEIVLFILSHTSHSPGFCKRAHYATLSMFGAVEGGQLHLAKYLVDHGVNVNLTTHDIVRSDLCEIMGTPTGSNQTSALCIAVLAEQTEMVEFLLQRGADPNLRYPGPHALGIAIHQGFTGIVSILLKVGANPNAKFYGKGSSRIISPLQLAAEIGSSAIFFLLLNNGAKMDCTPPVQNLMLHSALVGRSRDILDYILDSHPWPLTAGTQENFHLAISFLDRDIIQNFVNSGAKPCNPQVLILGTLKGDVPFIQYLVSEIEAHCGSLPESLGVMGMTLAARLGNFELLNFYENRGVIPYSAITIMAEGPIDRCPGCDEQISCTSALLVEAQLRAGSSALSEVLTSKGSGELNRVRCCKFLLNSCAKRWRSLFFTYMHQKAHSIALCKAIEYGYTDVIDTLYSSTESYCKKYDYHISPLAAAAKVRSIPLVEKMLFDNSKREKKDDHFEEALGDALVLAIGHDTAGREGETPDLSPATLTIVRMLLLKGADPNRHRSNGSLYSAVNQGDVELIKLLLANNAHAHGVGWHGQNPIHLAGRQGDIEVLKILLGDGDYQRQRQAIPYAATALLFAADNGRLDAVVYLLRLLTDAYGQHLNRHYQRAIYGSWQNGHDALARTICSFLEERFRQADSWNVENSIRHVLNESGYCVPDTADSAEDSAGDTASEITSETISSDDEETDDEW